MSLADFVLSAAGKLKDDYLRLNSHFASIKSNLLAGDQALQAQIDALTPGVVPAYYKTNVLNYAGVGETIYDGVTSAVSAINAALAAMPTGGTLYFPMLGNGEYLIDSDLTLAAYPDITLEFESGAKLSIADTKTLTGANTRIEAGLWHILDLNTSGVIAGTWNVLESYPEWFGGSGIDNTIDNTKCITNCFCISAICCINNGIYRVDNQITLDVVGSTVKILNATIKRFAVYSVSTEPIFWLYTSDVSIIGNSRTSSAITTENRAPYGVVRLGHKDMTESHGNVTHCKIDNLTIGCSIPQGQISGDTDKCLYMANPQFDNLVSYFHTISNVMVRDANYGIYMIGWCNANTIFNIHGYMLGSRIINGGALFATFGIIDNNITDVFLHYSVDSTMLLIDDYDNTSIGGVLHTNSMNTWKGLICEQGGTSAIGLQALVNTISCHYDIISNCYLGDVFPAGFRDTNLFNSVNATSFSHMQSSAVKFNKSDNLQCGNEISVCYTNLSENSYYKLLDVVMQNHESCIVIINFSFCSTSGVNWQGSGLVKYSVNCDSSGAVTCNDLEYYNGSSGLHMTVGGSSGRTCSIGFSISNNGTSINSFVGLFDICILGRHTQALPTFYTSAQLSSSSEVGVNI